MASASNKVRFIIGNLRYLVKGVALCLAGPLVADATQPCPPLQVEAVCKAGVAEAVTVRPAQGVASNLSFVMTSQKEGGVTDGQALVLRAGQSLTLPARATPIRLAILGLESTDNAADSACCFSNQQIEVEGLCTDQDAVPDAAPETESDNVALPDVGITLEISESCRPGTCSGVVTLTGDVPESAQLSLTATPAIVNGLQSDGGLKCAQTPGAALCAWDAPEKSNLVFTIPKSQPEGEFEVCAQIGVAAEPRLRAMALQTALNAQGYDVGSVDGLVGPATRAALAKMKAAAGITGEDLLPDEAMTALGLSDFADANADNNQMCATARIPKPPLVCDKRSTVQRGEECLCRLRNMVRVSARACACPKGTVASGEACVKRKVPRSEPRPKKPVAKALVCDRNTTVQRGAACACRYSGMRKISATKCRCSNGLPALPGVGCVKVTLSLPGRDKP